MTAEAKVDNPPSLNRAERRAAAAQARKGTADPPHLTCGAVSDGGRLVVREGSTAVCGGGSVDGIAVFLKV